MRPLLYLPYTEGLPISTESTTGTFAGDTAILAMDIDQGSASEQLQTYLEEIQEWLKN
jgi:hypothetical protein